MNSDNRLLTIKETCEILNISKHSVNHLFQSKQLKYVELNKTKRTSMKFINEMEFVPKELKKRSFNPYLKKSVDMNEFFEKLKGK